MSQCSSFKPQVIHEDSTIVSSLIIEDAVINDLSDLSQGVCGLRLYFNHDNVREIEVKLVSPSGQSIDLIGPINPRTSTTDNSSWDIEFLPCSETPIPDPGFSSTYSNEDNWFAFDNSIGSYHPNTGCLEDFDAGPVNGLWSLEINSISRFYPGELVSFEVIFCDDNFACSQCVADPGSFSDVVLQNDYCQEDEALQFDFSSIIPNDVNYNYEFYIVENDLVLETQTTPDLRSYGPGQYQICGLSYYNRQSASLPSDNSYSALNDLFNSASSPLCASFTDTCFMVNITSYADTLTIDTTLCSGDIFSYNGQDYLTEGEYRSNIGTDLCDTLVLIDFNTVTLNPLISFDVDILTCDIDKISLSVNPATLSPSTTITWKTTDGNIEGNTDSDMIQATQQGTYWLVLQDGGCIDSSSVEIDVDTELPVLKIEEPDTLDCNTSFVNLNLNSDPNAVSYSWTGPNGYTSNDVDVSVLDPGVYTVEVVLVNDCKASISQEVVSNISKPSLAIATSDISCDQNYGEVEILDLTQNNDYVFPGGNLNTTTQKIEYSVEGDYTITATSKFNGCIKDTTFTISSSMQSPNLSFDPVGNIDCSSPSVVLILDSDIPLTSYSWQGPNGSLQESGNELMVDQAGIYKVIVIAENGCVDSLEQEVISVTTSLPSITITSEEITCNSMTAQIDLQLDANNLAFHWYDDDGFTSIDEDPIVTKAGKYFLEVLVSPSCIVLDSIIVEEDLEKPIVNTSASPISCVDLVTQLQVINQDAEVSYEWSNPAGVILIGTEPSVIEAGTYSLQATGANGCTSNLIQQVETDTIKPTSVAAAPLPIQCDTKQVNLGGDGSSVGPNFTYAWRTSDGSIIAKANTLNPQVGSRGTYELIVTNTDNGCVAKDSVIVEEVSTDLVDFDFEKFDPPCSGSFNGSIEIGLVNGGAIPYTYSLDGFSYQSSPIFDKLGAGSYRVSVKDNFGCSFSKNVVLQDGIDISVDLEESYKVNLGDDLEVVGTINTNGDPLRTIDWILSNEAVSSGQERVTVRPLVSTSIEVLISTESGCLDAATAFIEVSKEKDVYVPNAFDPTSFGDNANFKVFATNAIAEVTSIDIFDKWGNKVFKAGPYNPKAPELETRAWDGTHLAQNLMPGVYVYMVEVLLIDGEQRKISGDVLLIR